MNKKEFMKFQNEQYIQNKMMEIELARMKEKQEEQERESLETAINVDYLVCLADLGV